MKVSSKSTFEKYLAQNKISEKDKILSSILKIRHYVQDSILHNYALPVCYSMLHKKSFIVNCLYRFV